jgi:hypothetical protein
VNFKTDSQTQPDDIVAGWSFATIFGEQGERSRPAGILVEHLDGAPPRLGLRGIDLAEIQHVTLRHATTIDTPVLDDAPVEMRLPVLPPLGLSQEHGE